MLQVRKKISFVCASIHHVSLIDILGSYKFVSFFPISHEWNARLILRIKNLQARKLLLVWIQVSLAHTYIVEVGVGLWLWCSVASITSLNAWLVICRARSNWAVPTLSNVKDCILDIWTPRSRWIPLHSMHTIMPKFVESHVASIEQRRINLRL